MLSIVRHSNVSHTTIASVLSTTHALSLLGRDVYNRSYDYSQNKRTSTAKLVERLAEDGFIYRVKVAMDNTLVSLFFCKPRDIQMARLNGQIVIMDATYKTNLSLAIGQRGYSRPQLVHC
ncbi:hypothetical protein V1507DRAFT_468615 [Lipomyces tetrasporus]